jgi:hypothetical protein
MTFVIAIALAVIFVRHASLKSRWALGAVCLAVACTAAAVLPTSGLAVRYPPLVHIVNVLASLLTIENPLLFRLPNALWTAALVLVLWQMLPTWKNSARIVALAGMMLGPLGWTYRTALFQACGEITLATAATLLLVTMLERKNERWAAALLGGLLGLWFLYRPTSLVIACVSVLLLFCSGRRKEAMTCAAIAAPVIVSWLALAPIFTASYGFTHESSGGFFTLHSLEHLWTALLALPMNMHPVALGVAGVAIVLALLVTGRHERLLVAIALIFGFTNAAAQHLLAGDIFAGVARYNVLLLPAVGFALGALMQGKNPLRITAAVAIVLLIAITPFDFIRFTQDLRRDSPDIFRTPTEGYLPLPLIDAVHAQIAHKDTMVILAPQYGFLDWLMMQGLLTAAEKDHMVQRSQTWTPDSLLRPVLIQAPLYTTYTPNITQEQEARLQSARAWALTQNDTIEKLGIEETVIVP